MSVFPVTVGLAFTKNRVKRRSRVSDLQHTGAVHIGRLLSCRCDLHLACLVRCTDTTRQVQVALLAAIDAHSIMDDSHMPGKRVPKGGAIGNCVACASARSAVTRPGVSRVDWLVPHGPRVRPVARMVARVAPRSAEREVANQQGSADKGVLYKVP